MNDCTRPPALTLAQLSAYLDGDADLTVHMHLDGCPACRQAAAELAVAQSRLQRLLWRATCPAPELLRDYAWSLLPQDEAARIAHHLTFCPYCTHDLFDAYYAGDTSGDDLFTEAARRLDALEYRRATRLAPAQAGAVRSAGAGGELQLFDAGAGVLVSVTAVRSATETERWVLEGAVSGIDTSAMQANLWCDDTLAAALVLDAGGDFHIPGLAAGTYYLILHSATAKLWLGPMPVGDR